MKFKGTKFNTKALPIVFKGIPLQFRIYFPTVRWLHIPTMNVTLTYLKSSGE